jgi:5-methyltetrahydropteroyltriglutamate--homocysteine methyltransferase
MRRRSEMSIATNDYRHKGFAEMLGATRRRAEEGSMKRSSDRILVSHVGSLPRPHTLLDLMKAKLGGQPYDPQAFDDEIRRAVGDVVRRQAETGIDVVTDGEMSKAGFFVYVRSRLNGFEARPGEKFAMFADEVAHFPEYYQQYFERAMFGATVAPAVPLYCVGPVAYVGQAEVKRDIDNLKAALGATEVAEAFLPSTAPSGVGYNEYYKTEEAYFHAVGEAMRTEYLAIVEAGFLLQIDDPFLSDIFGDSKLDDAARRKRADMYVEAINHSLRGIPEDRVRFHTCYGINEGPRIYEAALKDVVGHMLKVKAQAYSFEGANARHEHEYHLFENVKLPEGKILMPGVITHASNIVEHPELIAERITRYARLVGRENVIAGADCGFSSQAGYRTEVHPTVIWEKFKAMAEGARIASKRLWS